jgi:curved DNA-binding protein CbpA
MKYHPDRGGSTEIMQEINAEHDRLFEILKKQHNAKADPKRQTTETAEEFRNIIDALLRLDGLEVELCGSWLWIGGETKKHKDRLKALGCRWHQKKSLWYWHHPEEGCGRWKSKTTMSEIRAKYGSQIFAAGKEHAVTV